MNGIRGRGPIGPGDSTMATIRQRPQPASLGAPAALLRSPEPEFRRDFFTYPITFDALAAGASAQGAIQIQTDADFEWQKFSYFADIAEAAQTESTRVLPLVTVQITDTGTGRRAFSAPVPLPAIAGDGQIPFILSSPKVFSKNASVAFEVANFSAATEYNLRLLLIGAKLFKYGG